MEEPRGLSKVTHVVGGKVAWSLGSRRKEGARGAGERRRERRRRMSRRVYGAESRW